MEPMKPMLMSEVKNGVYQIEPDYQVQIDNPKSYMLFVMGFDYNKKAAKMEHPAILHKRRKVHEYKHYRDNGSKFWTSRAGVDLLFAVPLDKITLLPEKGYSYVKIEINGKKFSLNVSGGTFNGWTDSVRNINQTSTNHKIQDVLALASVAIPKADFQDDLTWTDNEREAEDETRFNKIVEAKKSRIKVIAELDNGKEVKIHLGWAYTLENAKELTASEVIRRKRWKGRDDKGEDIYRNCPPSGLRCGYVRVKMSQIDWNKTAQINNWSFA